MPAVATFHQTPAAARLAKSSAGAPKQQPADALLPDVLAHIPVPALAGLPLIPCRLP
ncbi:hypothetical protein AB0M41_38870 [Streptomyces sp. NPDC051896]|uniref:hypothetical protein n=1 Tax=Streptomyces sp. NPDC051896 TaxID=3155416 RepID=UPI0034238369